MVGALKWATGSSQMRPPYSRVSPMSWDTRSMPK